MTRSQFSLVLSCFFVLAGFAPARAASDDASLADLKAPVSAPFSLTIGHRAWDGNTHAMPSGRAELKVDGQAIWRLADVMTAAASADGSTVALLTSDYQVFVSRLPEPPRRIDGGPYHGPSLSSDGTFLVVQRLGEEGHILDKMSNTRGIALINLDTAEDRLLLHGNDLYAPSFATDDKVFFGSGGKDLTASLYLLDLASMKVARVTNRVKDARQTFPSGNPRLVDGMVVYRADGELFQVPEPAADDFVPTGRFDLQKFIDVEPISPNFGSVRIRRPTTQSNTPQIFWYFDVNTNWGPKKDWNCQQQTYDNHRGTDFNQSIGFNVVAAASGHVIIRYDGCADTDSPSCAGGYGNYLAIEHDDLTISLEAHGKKWTVAPLGSWHPCGATVMKSASSGNSSKPHVHHESWKDKWAQADKSRIFDPYKGSCDPNDPPKWSQQNGYLRLPGTTCTN